MHTAGALKGEDVSAFEIKHTLEILAGADRPVHRVGLDAEFPLDLLEQVKRIPRLAVHFVDERKDRDMPHDADLEQLSGLCLDALCRVNDHDRSICCHQRAVGILRKILVSGRIENIDAAAVIFKLHDRRSHGNSALLFDLHPVRDRMTGILLALDGTCHCDRAAVEQQLFSQCGFTGVRVRDDRKGPASPDLFLHCAQFDSSVIQI